MEVLLQLKKFTFAYPEAKAVLQDIDLEIEAGVCYCLTGPTGSGKTTLIMALKGLLSEGTSQGTVEISSGLQEELRIGVVLQDPEVQLLTTTVGAEVGFGLENLCVDPAEMPSRVLAALKAVNLDKPLAFPVDKLSMGQKYRLLMAALLVMEPRLLILDEPGAQLDPEGLERLGEILRQLKEAGVAVLLCEHRPEPLQQVVDVFWQLDGGTLRPGRWQGTEMTPIVMPPRSSDSSPQSRVLLTTKNLAFDDQKGVPIWSEVSLSLCEGQRLAITGANGSGKTTLLRCLAGFLKPSAGEIDILGGKPDPYRLRGRLGCLFQNPQKQLFENTVREEVSFPLKRLGTDQAEIGERAAQALNACGIAHLAELSPHKLSYGQKHLVALASVLAPRPELLLLDDPLAGLDGFYRTMVMDLLLRCGREHQMTLIWTSHDPDDWPGWSDRVLHLEGGCLVTV